MKFYLVLVFMIGVGVDENAEADEMIHIPKHGT